MFWLSNNKSTKERIRDLGKRINELETKLENVDTVTKDLIEILTKCGIVEQNKYSYYTERFSSNNDFLLKLIKYDTNHNILDALMDHLGLAYSFPLHQPKVIINKKEDTDGN